MRSAGAPLLHVGAKKYFNLSIVFSQLNQMGRESSKVLLFGKNA